MDHKIWIVEGYSNAEVREDINNKDNYLIKTSVMESSVPKWRVFQMKKTDTFDRLIEEYLKQHGLDVEVEVEMSENTFSSQLDNTFRYSHGLKNSSSHGCKNPNHGHLSFIELVGDNEYKKLKVKNKIIDELDKVVFIFDENIVYEDSDIIKIEYTVGNERFKNTYLKKGNKIIISEEETTAENLINLIAKRYNKELKEAGITKLLLSEGLQKGSALDLR